MSDRADSTFIERPFSTDDEPSQPSSRRGSLVGRSPLDSAIARGLSALFAAQAADGSWSCVEDEGVPGIALTVLSAAWFGALELEDAKRCVRALTDAQLVDGGFSSSPASGESTLAATALGRAALKVIGVSDAAPIAVRADACLALLGGYAPLIAALHAATDATALLCVMAGTLGADVLPALSPELAALPGTDRALDGRLRVEVASLIFACAAVRERAMPVSAAPSLLRTRARLLTKSRLVNYLGQFQNDDGSWGSSSQNTVLALVALEGVGMTKRDRSVARGLAWLDARVTRTGPTLSVSSSTGDVSATALALQTLSACDVPATDGALSDGLRFLEAHQLTRAQPRVSQPRVGAPLAGGWSHQLGNDTAPRCDVTADVLAALSIGGSLTDSTPTTASGLAWLGGMQNASGGFGVGAHGHAELPKGSKRQAAARASIASVPDLLALLEQPGALGDPATVETTARVLASLGEGGLTSREVIAERAVTFLAQHQLASGAWKSRTGDACVQTTAYALLGLARAELSKGAAVVPLRSATRALALRFLFSRQHADGGFGSGDASDVTVTALVLRALAAVFERGPRTAALRKGMDRAAEFLLAQPAARSALLALGAVRRATRDAPISRWHNSPPKSRQSRSIR